MSEFKVSDFVRKNNKVQFDSYRAGFFYYNVELNKGEGGMYTFQVPIEEVGNATLFAEDKSVFFMRWIRKCIEDKTIIKST